MAGKRCCVKKCHSTSHDRFGKKRDDGVRFFSFPRCKKNEGHQIEQLTKRRRMAWIAAVRRKDLAFNDIPDHMRVCSLHFQSGKPAYEMCETHHDWAPSLLLGHNEMKVPDKDGYALHLQGHEKQAGKTEERAGGKNLEHVVGRGISGGEGPPSAILMENTVGEDQIMVVCIDDSHIAALQNQLELQAQGQVAGQACHRMDYPLPVEDMNAELLVDSPKDLEEEEEEEGVYVFEYSNQEDEGESYRFKLAIDERLQIEEPVIQPPATELVQRAVRTEQLKRPLAKAHRRGPTLKGKMGMSNRDKDHVVSGLYQCLLCSTTFPNVEILREHKNVHEGKPPLVCRLCPPPHKTFKEMASLITHLHCVHKDQKKIRPLKRTKIIHCPTCKKDFRHQQDFDRHIQRHAMQSIVYQCVFCPFSCRNSKILPKVGTSKNLLLKKHLTVEHPGQIPRCDICNKSFKNVNDYLYDYFKHKGVTPFYCPKCKVYDLTERSFKVHLRKKHAQ